MPECFEKAFIRTYYYQVLISHKAEDQILALDQSQYKDQVEKDLNNLETLFKRE
jgi:hypothetical protein